MMSMFFYLLLIIIKYNENNLAEKKPNKTIFILNYSI